ncbi:MAG: hypothetical protein K0S41_233 [Anaerocolumna sp.]|nr:hypothetical protein [Anaerocolumna sp.]
MIKDWRMYMADNILSGGFEELDKLKNILIELNHYKDENDVLLNEEVRLEKSIKGMEKTISDEINSTTRKRKDEIEATYNEQIDLTRARIKKIKNKKEKSKNEKINERIDTETMSLKEEYNQFVGDTKSLLKHNRLPKFCNTKLYYALFMPKGIEDFFIICISLFVILLAFPYGIYTFFIPKEQMIYLVFIYPIIVIFFGGLYMLIENNTKDKHKEEIIKLRAIRKKIKQNKKQRNIIKNNILKDRDESKYGLDKFNQELNELETELNDINKQKQDALSVFDNTTRFVISEEIKSRTQEELDKLKLQYEKVYMEVKSMEDKIKSMSMEIASTYEAYLGKEFMSVEKLGILESFMEENGIESISEGILMYRESNK